MGPVALLVEGFESALLACSLPLLVLGWAVALGSSSANVAPVGAFGLAAVVAGWVRFAGLGGLASQLELVALLSVAAGLVALTAWPRLGPTPAVIGAPLAGLLAGVAATHLWLPCVGEAFGTVLNELPDRGLAGIARFGVYLLGLLWPLWVVVAGRHLLPDGVKDRLERWESGVGTGALAAMALATALGFHVDLLGYLFRLSGG
jgi:hypothetical protein